MCVSECVCVWNQALMLSAHVNLMQALQNIDIILDFPKKQRNSGLCQRKRKKKKKKREKKKNPPR